MIVPYTQPNQTAYEQGYDARKLGCGRGLDNPPRPAKLRQWLAGWDAANDAIFWDDYERKVD